MNQGQPSLGTAGETMQMQFGKRALLALLLAGLGGSAALRAQPDAAEEKPLREVYQDFRGSRSLPAWLQLRGRDADAVTTPEEQGLHIVLPATREKNGTVFVQPTFSVAGDFEITASYQLLAATKPSDGYGVGVSLSVSPTEAQDKFAKVARALRVKEGSVYITEYWNREPPKEYKTSHVTTDAKAGRLRLARTGSVLHFLVADVPGGDFREIKKREFGIEDVANIRLGVSGSPGNTCDARLVDLRIRARSLHPDPVKEPVAEVAPPPPAAEREPRSYLWLILAIGFGAVLLIAASAGAWFVARRRRATAAPAADAVEAPPESAPETTALIAFACPECGKNLKVKALLAGKKVKCPQCGKATLVPGGSAPG
jgi:hypothetical protein